MTFQDAIKTCFSKYADFKGRASRSEYWWFALFVSLVYVALFQINPTLTDLFLLATLLPSLAVGTRRLHDTNRSGWWQLMWVVPLIGQLVAIYLLVQPPKEPNRFGSPKLIPDSDGQ